MFTVTLSLGDRGYTREVWTWSCDMKVGGSVIGIKSYYIVHTGSLSIADCNVVVKLYLSISTSGSVSIFISVYSITKGLKASNTCVERFQNVSLTS